MSMASLQVNKLAMMLLNFSHDFLSVGSASIDIQQKSGGDVALIP